MNGKQHGKGVFISANGQKKHGEWKNGVRERWIIFNDDPEIEDIENRFKRFTVRNTTKSIPGEYRTDSVRPNEKVF